MHSFRSKVLVFMVPLVLPIGAPSSPAPATPVGPVPGIARPAVSAPTPTPARTGWVDRTPSAAVGLPGLEAAAIGGQAPGVGDAVSASDLDRPVNDHRLPDARSSD